MQRILHAAGLMSLPAEHHDLHGEPLCLVDVTGHDAMALWQQARAALTDHYPALLLSYEQLDHLADPDLWTPPAELLAAAATADVDAYVAERTAWWAPHDYGSGDEGYSLDAYDIGHFGPVATLAILPRPEPWAAFAYLNSFASMCGDPPVLLIAAARRWHERYRAVPTVVGLATGFAVGRPPTDLADAERLAIEHQVFAGLTARTTERAYARALLELDHWTLYSRP
jgi:hypothetical protein